MQEPPRGRNHCMRGWITAGLAQALDLLRLRGVCHDESSLLYGRREAPLLRRPP